MTDINHTVSNQELTPVSYQVTDSLCFKGLSVTTNSSDENKTPLENTRIVLCLHGWLDNAASFSLMLQQMNQQFSPHHPKNIPALNDTTFIAIDLIGHGLSSHRSADAQYHFYDWVYDILLLIEHNQWENVDIVGHSMGGMIASTFAATFPEKTRSLTLIDSLGYFTVPANETTQQLRKGLMSRLHHLKKTSGLKLQKSNQLSQSCEESVKRLKVNRHVSLASAVAARVAVSDLDIEHAQWIVERGVIENEEGVCWRSDRRLKNISPYRLTSEQAQQLLNDITAPILLLYGTKGHDMVPSALPNFTLIHPNVVVKELIGGHHIHMEQHRQTAELIKKFLIST